MLLMNSSLICGRSLLFNCQSFEHFLDTLFLLISNLFILESENVWSIILGFGKGSVQVYFPGQPSYSFPLMHSLVFDWELKRGTFPAPSPNLHRILGTFFVLLFFGALPCRFQQFTYFELWSMPLNLCRTTVFSWDYRSLNCARNWQMSLYRVRSILGLTLWASLLSRITILCCL